jgi:hypothetical protein
VLCACLLGMEWGSFLDARFWLSWLAVAVSGDCDGAKLGLLLRLA